MGATNLPSRLSVVHSQLCHVIRLYDTVMVRLLERFACRFGVTSYSKQSASMHDLPRGEIRRGVTSRQGGRATQDVSDSQFAMEPEAPVRASNGICMTRLREHPRSIRRATQ